APSARQEDKDGQLGMMDWKDSISVHDNGADHAEDVKFAGVAWIREHAVAKQHQTHNGFDRSRHSCSSGFAGSTALAPEPSLQLAPRTSGRLRLFQVQVCGQPS